MKVVRSSILIGTLLFAIVLSGYAQEKKEGQISGSFQSDGQYYMPDSVIGADTVPEHYLANSYANINYVRGKFSAGFRFESYLNTLQGYVPDIVSNNGIGIPYRYASYTGEDLEFTVGSFYEQFGYGLVLRTYEEKLLGIDNALDGARVKYSPIPGLYIKGLVALQRNYFDHGPGVVRGIDAEILVNDLIKKLSAKKTMVLFGGSFVSKYQKDDSPTINYPENVAAASGRLNVTRGRFNINGEYAYKINDPSFDNGYIYKPGNALLLNAAWSQKGLGVLITAKRVDNMSFRSDRNAALNSLMINQVPAIAANHTYHLTAIYPFSTQPKGEAGISGEIIYKFPKKSFLGKYKTQIALNYSRINSIEKSLVNDTIELNEPYTLGYSSGMSDIGDELFFQDINLELNLKLSKKVKLKYMFLHLDYNIEVMIQENLETLEHSKGEGAIISSNINIVDVTYKLASSKNIRFELQHLQTKKHYGDWAFGMIELTYPHWFVAVYDQWNYGNEDSHYRIHYYTAAAGIMKNATRIQLSYGKQRQGVVCVGGVCREVPASNGILLSITTSF